MRLAIVLVAAGLLGCGGSSSSSPGGSTAQFAFSATGVTPASVNVGSSSQVHFVNNDTASHQVASANCAELASASPLATGKDFTATLGPGPKTCTFNDGLNPSASAFAGTINVAAPNSPGY